MNPETTTLKESLLVWRRLAEPAPVPAFAFPFVLLAVGFILFLAIRRKDELKQLRIPGLVQLLLLAVLSFALGVFPVVAAVRLFAEDLVVALQLVLIAVGSFVVGLLPAIVVMLAGGLLLVTFRRHRLEAFILSILILLVVVAGGCYIVGFFAQGPFSALHATIEVPMIWVPVAALVNLVAAFYIGAMYFHDARSVHWSVASLLGLCRFAVFCLLGICFFLPGCQDYDTTITEAKVLMLFDVSGSMDAVDGQEGEGSTTRQEKIIRFLTSEFRQGSANKTFIEHLLDATPVACYRFGGVADEDGILFDAKNSKSWTAEQWRTWFRPDKIDKEEILKNIPANITTDAQRAAYLQAKQAMYAALREGTDVGGSVLQVLQRESNSRIQAVIIFSDGNSNRGDEEAIRQVLERAGNPKRPIHVITVGVGDYKQPVRIRINPLVAPQAVRADDGVFEVRVPVFGDGLPGEEFEVALEVQRVKDRNGIELKKDPVYVVGKQKGTFGGGGEFPYAEVLFKVNLEELTKIRSADDAKGALQGQWNFTAKLPRHAREAINKDEPLHVSQVRPVMVNDSTLRVLLFASGPARDYQYVRTLMAREVEAKRAKLSIYLQTAKGVDDVQQDVDGSHLLNDFPNKLERPKEGKGAKKGGGEADAVKEGDPMNLKSYDVIIAFDPDWTQLTKTQKELLQEWVEGDSGGGIIFVADAVYLPRLIPPVNDEKFKTWDLKPVYSLLPVVLGRLPASADPGMLHDATIPYKLDFTGIAKGLDFMKLDDESPMPLAGWPEFFGKLVPEEFPGPVIKVHPERGFHGLLNYLRIAKAKDGAEVIATINDPKAPKTIDGKAQPYFVSMRVGKGKSFFIGSSEVWRLRTFKEEYHQRFWVKLARYVSSGSGSKSFGRFSMAGEYVTGIVPLEAEVRDKDGFPLSPDASPVVTVRRVDGRDVKDEKLPVVPLKAKKTQSKWDGTFTGSMRLDKEGFYEARIDILGTDESITQTFEVKSPNVEMADLRTNFPKLYNLATDATPAMLARLDDDTRQRLEGGKDRPRGGPNVKVDTGGARLFFRMATAQPVSQCIAKVRPEEDKVKGQIHDLWDWGPKVYEAPSWDDIPGLVWAMYGVPAVLLLIVMLAMATGGRWLAALGVAAALALIEVGMACVIYYTVPDELFQPSAFGVLLVVPPLICLLAAGILLVAERYLPVLAVLAGMILYLAVLLLVQLLAQPEWAPVKVDFTVMLILIAGLLSLEWFTRKMLRLA